MVARFPFPKFCLPAAIAAAALGGPVCGQSYIASEDEAFYEAYRDGWETGDNGGRGFGAWRLLAPEAVSADPDAEQYAGFFLAEAGRESDLTGVAREGRAFGIFANGTGFESTVAFRPFDRALNPGDVFSLRFEFDGFKRKFASDSEKIASAGIGLRSEAEADSMEALAGSRALVVAVVEGLSTYQIFDAAGRFNTRVFLDPDGVAIGITLREDGRYDARLRTLGNDKVTRFDNRRLRRPVAQAEAPDDGAAEAPGVRGFVVFNLNGGAHNVYFGAPQVSRREGAL